MLDTKVVEQAVDAIADRLIGQCLISLDEAIDDACMQFGIPVEEVRQKQSFHEMIDAKVFCCDGCGWYCDTEELRNETGALLCDDCAEEDEEDEDA